MKEKMKKAEWNMKREDFMTQDELKEMNDRLSKLTQNRGEMGDLYSRWEDEEIAYKGDQAKTDKRPNSRVNIINATIEGQVSAIVEQNITVTTRGESPADQHFADWARIGLDWTFRKNRIKKVLEVHERRRLKFGVGIFKVYFDEDALNGFGLVKICATPLNKIYIDNKIKDPLMLQDAEYIAETVRVSKTQMEEIYGEKKASVVNYGAIQIEDTTVFDEKETMDDEDSATVIQWFERYKGKLRLIEFTCDGLLLYDSQKEGNREDNQKNSDYKRKSYYKYVNDKYPYFFTPLYTEEGQMWGFGDCKLLVPIQDMINDLYDKIRITARPNLILFDPDSEVDLEDFDENSLQPRPAMLTDKKAVEVVEWGQVNPAYWQLLNMMHQEAQRVTRFSNLMMGQSDSSDTATEATIQQQQGNSTTDQKKTILQETLIEMSEYILGLMMENYKGAKAFRIQDDKDEYKWIDFRQLSKIPVMKPATDGFMKQYKESRTETNRTYETNPKWELVTDESNNPLAKNIDLDIEISIGAGLPKNKTFLWQMIQRLAAIVVLDQSGQQKNLINYEELRKFVKEFLGLPLDDTQQPPMSQPGMQQPIMQQKPAPNPGAMGTGTLQNANAPLTAQGMPSPMSVGGGGMIGNNSRA